MQTWERNTLLISGGILAFSFLIPIWRSPYNAEYVSLPQWVYEGIKHSQLTHISVKDAILRAKSRLLLQTHVQSRGELTCAYGSGRL